MIKVFRILNRLEENWKIERIKLKEMFQITTTQFKNDPHLLFIAKYGEHNCCLVVEFSNGGCEM